ncbi:MAG: EAL domain-containing protein, partial [Candidatus Thiodiazotropha sp.]
TMAKGLGLNLIAEGVENQTQIEHLSKAGCGLAQGFFFSHPVPENELLKFIKGLRTADNKQKPEPSIVGESDSPGA